MEQVKTQVFPLSELEYAKYNPRKMLTPGDPEFEALCRSIETFGYVDMIVVNVRDGKRTIVSGHQRASAMRYLGRTEAECIIVDLDDAREKALNVAMNKISGEWDKEKLKELLKDLDLSGLDMTLTGFDDEELRSLIGDPKLGDEDFDEDEVLAKPTYSKPGDLWHLGPHKIICGDSTLPETYKRLMGEEKAALILTDLPYNVNVEKKAGKIMNDNMPDADFYKFVLAAYRGMYEPLADDGMILVWHADGNGLIFRKAFEEAGFTFLQCGVWAKDQLVLGRSPYQWQHEPCLVGSKGGEIHWYGGESEGSVWRFDRPKKSDLHPTQKSIPLIIYQIRNSTKEGEVVLDPFLGSGTTLIACCETGRICYGNELDPKFADVIIERYINWSGGFADVRVERDGTEIPYAEVPKPS